MKPVVSALNAWTCIVISIFGIVILSILGAMFKSGHHSVMGSTEDPKNGKTVASTIFGAVFVYIGFLVFCSSQAFLHVRESRKGAIALS